MDLERAKQEFQKYVETFDTEDKFIQLKQKHSYRVMEISKQIATNKKLSSEEIELATLIGLLHDIGRFYQIETTQSFNDRKFDHSNYGVMYLFDQGHIRDFIQDTKYDEVIKKAVLYHNDLFLPKNLTEQETLFCKLIRDADKIDIYRVYVREDHYKWDVHDISPKILETFQKKQPIDIREIRTKTDTTMCVLAFLFDINFKESYEILAITKNFEDFLNVVEVKEESKTDWQRLKKYCNTIIERRDKNARKEI